MWMAEEIEDYGRFGSMCWGKKGERGKIRYTTQEIATQAAADYQLEHGEYMNVYQCDYCGWWHIGHHVAPYERTTAAMFDEAAEKP
jgi:hypothetical protein